METLPVEMVERIVQQLTPQDLARCSAVSREWREIFNEDWMWKPHCDPELEEPLRTIPSVVTSAFTAPEGENSTLSPNSRWRLTCLPCIGLWKPHCDPELEEPLRTIPSVVTSAFTAPEGENSTLSPNSRWKLAVMREKRLWKNWRSKDVVNSKEQIKESENKRVLYVDFLTDTLVVVWYSDRIEVLDVRVMPATLVAKTDTSIHIGGHNCYDFSVIRTNMLFMTKEYSIEVFNVDIMNKSIDLKHNIHFDCHVTSYGAKDELYMYSSGEESKLVILNLDTGKILKEETCPVKNTENKRVYISKITSSTTSDFFAVTYCVTNNDIYCNYKYYIYSPKELAFMPGPVPERHESFEIALSGNWIALPGSETLTVFNIQTHEVLDFEVILQLVCFTHVCYNKFVFISFRHRYDKGSCLNYYCPVDKTVTTFYEGSDVIEFETINNKFIAIFDWESEVSESVFKFTGKTVEKCDISVTTGCKINRSCTKMLSREWLNDSCTWCVSHLW